MKFRSKRVVIEAEPYREEMRRSGTLPEGVVVCYWPEFGDVPTVHTLEGDMRVSDGDWIITGLKGERYPCKPDIFAMKYEEFEC